MTYYKDESVTLYHGDALDVARTLQNGSVDCIVTSPPYFGLRDYGVDGQYGLEESPAAYVETMRVLFSELRRVLADDGTLWLNVGDSYSGDRGNKSDTGADNKNQRASGAAVGAFSGKGASRKNLLGIPWRLAFALQDDGWILRNAIVWHKPNAMPESVTDRLSGRYEHVFLFSKRQRYWFDLDPIRTAYDGDRAITRNSVRGAWGIHKHEQVDYGRNPGDVWDIATQPFAAAHFAVMPPALAERCIKAGCKSGGTVLDPFSGSGTTGLAAARLGRKYVGIDLNRNYLDLSLRTRLSQNAMMFEQDPA